MAIYPMDKSIFCIKFLEAEIGNFMKKDEFVTVYTKERGKLCLSEDEWLKQFGCYTFHNVDGPAVVFASGTKLWLLNNKRHRINGPAIELNDGTCMWYIDGLEIGKKTVNQILNSSLKELQNYLNSNHSGERWLARKRQSKLLNRVP